MAMAPARLKKFIGRHAVAACAVAAFVCLVLLHGFALPHMGSREIAVQDTNKHVETQDVFLPHLEPLEEKEVQREYVPFRSALRSLPSPESAQPLSSLLAVDAPEPSLYEYRIQLRYDHAGQQTRFQAFPKGCIYNISLNGKDVPFPDRSRCNFKRGVIFDLAPAVKEGDNILAIKVTRPGFHVAPLVLSGDGLAPMLGMLLLLSFMAGIFFLMRGITREWYTGLIMATASFLYVLQFARTGFNEYAMDMPGHLEYAIYIATHWWLPKPYEAWTFRVTQFYHPPLYYALQAALLSAAEALGSFDPVSAVRSFSLCCMMGFLGVSSRILKRLVVSPIAYAMVFALLAFYPGTIMYAARVDSHLLYYVVHITILYLTLRWLQTGQARNAIWIAVMVGVGLAIRSNTLMLMPVLAIASWYQWRRGGWPRFYEKTPLVGLAVVALLIGLSLNFGRTMYYQIAEGWNEPIMISNVKKVSKLATISNTPSHIFLFDVESYFANPFWPPKDGEEREYFWNSVLKTSLFGQFSWQAPALASVLSLWLLFLIAYAAFGSVRNIQTFRHTPEWWFCAITLAVALAALLENRLARPFSYSEDFRYIYPALVSFCAMIGIILRTSEIKKHVQMSQIGGLLVVTFTAIAALFSLMQ